MAKRELITHERLTELLHYDPLSGLFTWKVKKARAEKGQVAGAFSRDGYCRIGIDGRDYLRSRLAWFYITGKWPKDQIDHIDTNRANDIFANLREANNVQNSANKGKWANNTSGYKGAYYMKRAKLWLAQIKVNNKLVYLGYYKTASEAHAAYSEAAHRINGEFARTS